MGSNSTLAIGRDAMIKARDGADGVFAEGAGQSIVNRGLITAGEFGIRGAIWGEVKNFGTISADHGIFYEGAGSKITNYGRIEAYDGVDLRGDDTIIDLGKGDQIILRYFDRGDLDYSDLAIS